jgi:hypothetical protein
MGSSTVVFLALIASPVYPTGYSSDSLEPARPPAHQ